MTEKTIKEQVLEALQKKYKKSDMFLGYKITVTDWDRLRLNFMDAIDLTEQLTKEKCEKDLDFRNLTKDEDVARLLNEQKRKNLEEIKKELEKKGLERGMHLGVPKGYWLHFSDKVWEQFWENLKKDKEVKNNVE